MFTLSVIHWSVAGKSEGAPQSSAAADEATLAAAHQTASLAKGIGMSYDPTTKVVAKKDLQETVEYSEEEKKNFERLYEDTLSEFVEGQLVTGKILAINNREVAVDIGFKSEGVIPIEEFADPKSLKIGDDIEVFLDNVEDQDGQLVLSKKKADFMRVWERVLAAYEKGEILQGRCTRRIKGGIVVDLMGIDAFLPGSQIDLKPIRDFDAYIGQVMDFRVVKVNELRKNIVVSHRVLVEEAMSEQRARILENLAKGQVLEGTVKNITDFGVFIDLGGVDGLLHINDLSWGRVSHPSEIVSLDQKIKVQVLDFNEAKDRISLGLKQLQPHPWVDVDKKYPVGSVVRGKVVSISDYGAFVELERGVEGLIHISEMSWTQHIRHPSKIVSVGEMVDAKVLNVDLEERKISLGLKQLEPDPWDDIEQKYPLGSHQRGVVRNLTNFGAFVELEEGIDGLVHISDLSWTKKIRHPGEVVKKGDEVEVVVLNVDKANRRISLGYKQTKENPWEVFEKDYGVHTRTTGKIVRMIDKGVIVELPAEVDGFVPLSHLAKPNLTKPADGYAVGDTLELVVIEFNKDNKKIILSERLAKDQPESEGGRRKGKRGRKAESQETPAEKPRVEVVSEEEKAAFDAAMTPGGTVAAEQPNPSAGN
ncbi:MAG: 30S ribosomal protein S1 [candidate division KSB1 bacterium]|nr:30S ribosomal protein S1 [candidate division KSB1 bacterium]MDZ7275244.1 30S ribosomal protein S1 [candidate division KSB1 bacterium]MDZ7287412.1 30S ribosomal protein S1 [candidate division KSB1 bacterium]MDZ7299526.1 30S ribosomal protein S1 [candidate division KSB1 bacterium]MDZ7305429.1 30S ribosomal protein S1 [candidate division KSB1 bacterium]